MIYLLLRLFLLPFAFLPHRAIHAIGRPLGRLAYHLLTKFRKRALSNLALSDLPLTPKQRKKIAIASFQNLVITCLEYPKFARSDVSKSIICENPEEAASLIARGQGIVFFCGHQSNWETLFLDGTRRMPGVAIGRPIKDKRLYQWIVSIRERYGGTIVPPKKALGKGLRALREGKFMGIVGDQGMPGGYLSSFLGRRAYTSPAPAMLAYKTGSPLMVATTRRKRGKYYIHYSDPIWPNLSLPMEEEVPRMMDRALSLYASSIRDNPGEWMWQHNRWKQAPRGQVRDRFRHEAILIILGPGQEELARVFRTLYPTAFLTFLATTALSEETIVYSSPDDCFLDDYRFKCVFNCAGIPGIAAHYSKRAAIEVVDMEELQELAPHAKAPHDIVQEAVANAP